MTSNDAPRLYRYSRQYSTERRCYYVLLSEKIQNTTHGRLERDIDHSPLIESSRSSSAPSHVVCAVFRWVSDPYGPTVYPYCLSGLWDHTQEASLGQGVGGVSGNRSTVLFKSTCRGGLGKRRALLAILFLLVVFLFFIPWSSACTVVFSTTVGVYVFGSPIDLRRLFAEWVSRFDCSPDTVDNRTHLSGAKEDMPSEALRWGRGLFLLCDCSYVGAPR